MLLIPAGFYGDRRNSKFGGFGVLAVPKGSKLCT